MFEHDRDAARRIPGSGEAYPYGDAAKRSDGKIERHADAAHRPAQHHPLAMQIDDAKTLVSRFIRGGKAHG